MLTLGWPQIVMIVLFAIEFGLVWNCHGELKKGRWNLFTHSAAMGLMVWLMYMGGFFTGGVR